jgi:GxxExxY protein
VIHHRDTEGTEQAEQHVTGVVIGAAIDVHRHLGPGLLESIYQPALEFELRRRKVEFKAQVVVGVRYRGTTLPAKLRLDLVVERRLIVEVKAVERILNLHSAQLLTYLKLSGLRLGLIINFNVSVLRNGIRRLVSG